MSDAGDHNAALERLMNRAARIEERVALIRGRGEAAGGRIRVEADAAGDITRFRLSESLIHTPIADLNRIIPEAIAAAQSEARAAAAELREELNEDSLVIAMAHAAGAAAPEPTVELEDDDPFTRSRAKQEAEYLGQGRIIYTNEDSRD